MINHLKFMTEPEKNVNLVGDAEKHSNDEKKDAPDPKKEDEEDEEDDSSSSGNESSAKILKDLIGENDAFLPGSKNFGKLLSNQSTLRADGRDGLLFIMNMLVDLAKRDKEKARNLWEAVCTYLENPRITHIKDAKDGYIGIPEELNSASKGFYDMISGSGIIREAFPSDVMLGETPFLKIFINALEALKNPGNINNFMGFFEPQNFLSALEVFETCVTKDGRFRFSDNEGFRELILGAAKEGLNNQANVNELKAYKDYSKKFDEEHLKLIKGNLSDFLSNTTTSCLMVAFPPLAIFQVALKELVGIDIAGSIDGLIRGKNGNGGLVGNFISGAKRLEEAVEKISETRERLENNQKYLGTKIGKDGKELMADSGEVPEGATKMYKRILSRRHSTSKVDENIRNIARISGA